MFPPGTMDGEGGLSRGVVMSKNPVADEYPVEKGVPKPPHGNTKTGLPFYRLRVGESFVVAPDEYSRTNSARAHYKKKHLQRTGVEVEFSSGQEKDATGALIGYRFRRER